MAEAGSAKEDGCSRLSAGLSVGTTDLEIFRALYGGFRSVPADLFFAFLSTSAIGWLLFVLALPLLFSKVWRFDILRHLAAVVLSASAPALKVFFPHDRPSRMVWVEPHEAIYHGSFPSGHTACAFVVALTWSFILGRRGYGKWIPLLLIWAAFVGLSRIYRGVHWPSDVLGGALWGTVLALLLDFAWPRPKAERAEDRVNAQPGEP